MVFLFVCLTSLGSPKIEMFTIINFVLFVCFFCLFVLCVCACVRACVSACVCACVTCYDISLAFATGD